jgi:hypothetical protein
MSLMVEGLYGIKTGLRVIVEHSYASFISVQRGNYVEVSTNKPMIIIDGGVASVEWSQENEACQG